MINALVGRGPILVGAALAAAYLRPPMAEPRSVTIHRVPVHVDRPVQAKPIPTLAPEIVPDLAVSGVVVDGDSSPQVPVPGARVVVYSRQGRCDWSVETQSSGLFERHCYDVGRRGSSYRSIGEADRTATLVDRARAAVLTF